MTCRSNGGPAGSWGPTRRSVPKTPQGSARKGGTGWYNRLSRVRLQAEPAQRFISGERPVRPANFPATTGFCITRRMVALDPARCVNAIPGLSTVRNSRGAQSVIQVQSKHFLKMGVSGSSSSRNGSRRDSGSHTIRLAVYWPFSAIFCNFSAIQTKCCRTQFPLANL